MFQKGVDLGFRPDDDDQWAEFGWIAVELARVTVPEPWSVYSDDQGRVFYYDHNTGRVQAPGSRLQAPGSRLRALGSRLQAPGSKVLLPRVCCTGPRALGLGSRA